LDGDTLRLKERVAMSSIVKLSGEIQRTETARARGHQRPRAESSYPLAHSTKRSRSSKRLQNPHSRDKNKRIQRDGT
jgi:hypothetical protein